MKNENPANFLPTNNKETRNKKETNNKVRRFAFWFGCLDLLELMIEYILTTLMIKLKNL